MGNRRLALNATLHCLTGCAIGEIAGLMIGQAAGLPSRTSIALAVALAFLFGFGLSTLPLLERGLSLRGALRTVVAADALSIAVMELVDNTVMAVVPGAMETGLVNPTFWLTMSLALSVAFVAAYPVNLWLLGRGRGHALTYDGAHLHHASRVPTPGALAMAITAFLLGGLVVSLAEANADDAHTRTLRLQTSSGPAQPASSTTTDLGQ